MVWNDKNVHTCAHAGARVLIKKELDKKRDCPVTGSESYWQSIFDSKFTDFEKEPHKYRIGRGQQGVLSTYPYTGELHPMWRFKTVPEAERSSALLYQKFLQYLDNKDFVGADIAKKFLHMGFTRARRYANHRDGKKYNSDGSVKPRESDAMDCEKARSAEVFRKYWVLSRSDERYLKMKKEHRNGNQKN